MKTRYILATALLALAASSCTDLDVDVKSKLTEYPSSEIAMEGKMADAYYAFRKPLGINRTRVRGRHGNDPVKDAAHDRCYRFKVLVFHHTDERKNTFIL